MASNKAKVTQIKFGAIEIEGLMLSDGSFAVSVSQTAELFQFDKNQASRNIKALLGEDFQFDKTTSELNPKKVNILTLSQFEIVLRKLDRRGNWVAREVGDATMGLSLHQLFCDAFGVRFEAADRQAWLVQRMSGIDQRNTFTDTIARQYLATHPGVDKVPVYAFSNPSDALNVGLTGHPAKYWREKRGIETNDDLRDAWSQRQLERIKNVEELADRRVDAFGETPADAVKGAIAALLYEVWDESKLFGDDDPLTQTRNKMRKLRLERKLAKLESVV